MKENKYFSVHKIALIGILAAAIFVLTKFVSIPIPSPLGKTALSVGNAMCILSALLFGPVTGGLAAWWTYRTPPGRRSSGSPSLISSS